MTNVIPFPMRGRVVADRRQSVRLTGDEMRLINQVREKTTVEWLRLATVALVNAQTVGGYDGRSALARLQGKLRDIHDQHLVNERWDASQGDNEP